MQGRIIGSKRERLIECDFCPKELKFIQQIRYVDSSSKHKAECTKLLRNIFMEHRKITFTWMVAMSRKTSIVK